MEGKQMSPEQQMVLLASLQAKTFIQLYITIADTQRENLWHFYRKNSVLIWNGIPVPADKIQRTFKSLPGTKHHIDSLDAQPIIRDLKKKHFALVVTTSGRVAYGTGKPVRFHQSFVLERNPDVPNDPTKFYILSHNFRNRKDPPRSRRR
uniref:NTF2-related export protein n=1 Tax=Lotharella oceanica TaxID=641309 RepID=A0A7S2X5P4_9EUKA|mmetsp:Transcript_10130/g.19433  ORF Transcript_10130/g.19433 Transcript_10130/m.19433 type:complete len:150 (+) Transcript_10130:42-491(+)